MENTPSAKCTLVHKSEVRSTVPVLGPDLNFTVIVEPTGRCSYVLGRQGLMEWKERPRVCAASMTEF